MEPIAERIAGLGLPTVLLLIAVLTALRAASLNARSPSSLRPLADVLESVVTALAIVFFLVRPFLFQSSYVSSGSMTPTLQSGDHILVNKWAYRWEPPRRGDVLVFQSPKAAGAGEKDFIKRLIGLPGDTIAVTGGTVTVGKATYTPLEIRRVLGEDSRGSGSPTSLRLTPDSLCYGNRHIHPAEFAAQVGKPDQPVRIEPGQVLCNGVPLADPFTAEDPAYTLPPQTVPPGEYFVLGDNRNGSDDSHHWGTFPMNRVVGRADFIFWPPSHIKRLGRE